MPVDDLDRVIISYGVQAVIIDVRQKFAGKLDGAEIRIAQAIAVKDLADLVFDKPDVKARVVRHQHRIADKV